MRGAAFLVLVVVMIFLFAFTFAVLGKGEYEPSTQEEGGFAPEVSIRA